MYKDICSYEFVNDYIKDNFENKKEYYYLGFQSVDSYITKIVYNYLSECNSELKFCCDFTLLQKIVKRILSKEYFNLIIKLDEKYVYSFIGAIICDNPNTIKITNVICDIYKVEEYLLKIFKKEENKYLFINKWLQKNNYTLITNYSYSNNINCTCSINNLFFSSDNKTMLEAKYDVCEEIAKYLINNKLYYNIKEIIGEYTIEESIEKLDYLYQEGYINNPNYIYLEHDNFEQIKYEVRCNIEGLSFYSVKIHNTKEKAKLLSAYSMLKMIEEQL